MLRIIIGAALLTGCGRSQALIGTPGTMPMTTSGSLRVPRGSGALTYAAADGTSYVLTYPGGKLVGTINEGATDACSDNAGDVFLTVDSRVDEFVHGATTPSESLSVPSTALGCAVDPVTGNLAVLFERTSGNDVAVFQNASGAPTLYNSGLNSALPGYDNRGDLFVDGVGESGLALSELPSGGNSFAVLTFAGTVNGYPGTIQWDGSHLTLESGTQRQGGRGRLLRINRLSISGLKLPGFRG